MLSFVHATIRLRTGSRHVRATSAASLPCRLSPSTIRVGGVLLACEQRRLAAIVTADMVGYSHAAYEQIYYSSLMPRTYLCARLMATLYHVPTSRSLRVLWTLEEIGATVEVKSLGVRPRLQEPEYLAINPAGTLPALIDGDRAIYESLAICEYLAARHGSDMIVAPDEPERPEFVQWLLYGEATLQAPLSAMARVGRIRNTTPEMQAGIDAVLSDARHSLSMRVKLLEQRLESRDFLVAGRMTLADISVGYPLNHMGKPDFASLLGPRATAYRERLLARPAFQRAAAVP